MRLPATISMFALLARIAAADGGTELTLEAAIHRALWACRAAGG